jgi:hypothetical protein
MESVNIINFYGLPEEWQDEAISNLDELAYDTLYLEPVEGHDPREHILWDLLSAMRHEGVHEGFEYNAVITISNNSALLLNIDNDMETTQVKQI